MADSAFNNFTLQRMVELGSHDSDLLVDLEIERAKHDFPMILEKREDSLVGRGHHESYHLYVPTGQIICFLWDEDHDERVFLAASQILRKLNDNGKNLVLMFAERKASLTVVTTNQNAKHSLEMNLGKDVDPGGDVWSVQISTSGPELAESGIINTSAEASWPYLRNLLDTRNALTDVWKCLELRDLEVAARKKLKK